MPKPPANKPPRQNGGQSGSVVQQVQTLQTYAGPLPQPADLQHYNDIVPGAAERILQMAEAENQHRHTLESRANEANIAAQTKQLEIAEAQAKAIFRSDLIGQIFGFLVGLFSIGGGVYLALNGQPWAASALFALPLAGIIRALRDRAKSSQ